MTRLLFKTVLFLLPVIVLTNCGSDGPGATIADRITFPVVLNKISPLTDTTIFGEQGTRIFIEKESFQFSDGTAVTDSVEIELKEFYKKPDMILADLSTQSDGKLLESAGMINIKASADKKEVMLKPGKRIVVHFPKKIVRGKMDLFYADKATDSTVNNWKVDTTELVKTTLKLASYGWWYPASDDSTGYDFIPKGYVDTGYYWNPIDFYVSSFNFSETAKKEIETTKNRNSYPYFDDWNDYGAECEMEISKEGKIRNAKVNTRLSAGTKAELLKFLNGLPTLEPGRDKHGTIIERRGLMFIKAGNIIPLYKTSEEYMRSFNSKYAKYENSPIKSMNDAELNYYVFSVSKLGWINCDRFLDAEKKIDYFVKGGDPNTKVKMVFKLLNGVLLPVEENGMCRFRNVPAGTGVTIVAIKNENGQIQTAFQDVTLSETPLQNLNFKPTTLGELRAQLEKLEHSL